MKHLKIFFFLFAAAFLPGLSLGQDLKMIQEEAEKEWPDSERMRQHKIKGEMNGFKELSEFKTDKVVSRADLKVLKENAKGEWPKSYRMQAYYVKKEIKAGHELAEFKTPKGMPKMVMDTIWRKKSDEWAQWTMRIYGIKKEVKAWQDLQKYPKEKVQEAAKEWPEDYSMQLYKVKKGL